MSYTVSDKLPESFFVDTLTEKAEMLKKHLKNTNSSLAICANIGPNMVMFKFFNPQEEDSLKLVFVNILYDVCISTHVTIGYN